MLKAFFNKHPFLFFVFALLTSRIVGLGAVQVIQTVRPDLSIQNDVGWLLMLLYAGVTVTLVYWTNTAKESGFSKPASAKEWLLWLPTLALVVPPLVHDQFQFQFNGLLHSLLILVAAIGVAVNEEVLFRGVLLRAMLRYGNYAAIFVPSVLFGLIHFTNVLKGADLTFSLMQTGWTIAMGVGFAALRLRNQSLYPVIAFHIVMDGVEYFTTGETGIHPEAFPLPLLTLFFILNVLFALYALWLFGQKTTHASSPYQQQNHPVSP